MAMPAREKVIHESPLNHVGFTCVYTDLDDSADYPACETRCALLRIKNPLSVQRAASLRRSLPDSPLRGLYGSLPLHLRSTARLRCQATLWREAELFPTDAGRLVEASPFEAIGKVLCSTWALG